MSDNARIRAVIADDHDLFRDGMRAMLAAAADIEVVGEAADGYSALDTTIAASPDVLLLDVEMPGLPVLSTITRVLAESPHTRVIIVTMHRDRVLGGHLLAAGASAFISKSSTSAELIDAVRRVAAAASSTRTKTAPPSESVLSQREREVLRLIGEGLSNHAISQRLSITIGTVKRHNTHIFANGNPLEP
ncbi:response regulator transcription factor [Agromyces bauzanensis]|uniref:DNA-binding response regulator n=1 Tax=Agromyces bauzanensis TaxID=1308924 RepID=A0A917PWC8_9MICO|nr:response regulator transcription factor [Agromyces bauzanensis]GGJ94832.1 DNA-binding response regulator [Agromyces bauzanensis]